MLLAIPLAAAAVLQGVGLARREARRPVLLLVIPHDEVPASIDGVALRDLRIAWRGPLAFLDWREADGTRRHLSAWPDNLDSSKRRELRLAMAMRLPAHVSRSVAP